MSIQRWQHDLDLILQIRLMRGRGEGWNRVMDVIEEAGYASPCEGHLRRVFRQKGWDGASFPLEEPENTPLSSIPPSDLSFAIPDDMGQDDIPAGDPATDTRTEAQRAEEDLLFGDDREPDAVEPDRTDEIVRYLKAQDQAFRARQRLEYERVDAQGMRKWVREELRRVGDLEQAARETSAAAINACPRPAFQPVLQTLGDRDVFVLLADTHFGKLVDETNIGQGYAYNRDIAADYLDRIEQELFDYSLRLGGVRDLHVLFGGDVIDNSVMRDGQAFRIDMGVGEQRHFAAEHFTDFMRAGKRMGFRYVKGRGVAGNHGRLRKRLDDDRYTDNHEWGVYKTIELALADDPDTRMHVSPRENDYFEVRGLRYYLEHGSRVQGGGGDTPVPGIKNRIDHLEQSVLPQGADVYLFAHFHQSYAHNLGNRRWLIGSGCFDGGDDFVCGALAKTASSSQWLWAQDPTDGIIDFHEVSLAPKRAGVPLIAAG